MKMTSFIDESGIGDLTDYSYKNFVLTSVVVDEKELQTIYGYFNLIKLKYGLPENVPFHTYDLLENPRTKLSPKQGKLFIKSMCEFIDLVPMKITVVHTDKNKFRKDFNITDIDLKGSKENKEKRGLIYYLSALGQCRLFIDYLSNKNGVGYIHADSRTYQDRELLDAFLHVKQEKRRGGVPNEYCHEARKRLVSITFADKGALSNGIQLADFASFVTYAHLERKINFFKEIGLHNAWNKLRSLIELKTLVGIFGKENINKYV